MKNRLLLVAVLLLVIGFGLNLTTFTVRETERAIVLLFGEARREIAEPGLHVKWPWPVEHVVKFDARLHLVEGPLEEGQTKDGRAVLVSTFALYRIEDALQFLRSMGTLDQAERMLERDLRDAQLKVVGAFPFDAFVSQDPAAIRLQDMERLMLAHLRERTALFSRGSETAARSAVSVAFVGIRRLALPESVTEKVLERMKAEREAKAAEIAAQGEAEALRLKSVAEADQRTALDLAEADARKALAEAERAAAEHSRAYADDPELAIYLRKLEALKKLLAKRATVVLDTRTPPLDLLAPDARAKGGR